MIKDYDERVEVYIREEEYFMEHWKMAKQLVYGTDDNKIIENLRVWKDEPIDIVYSITYPYNLTPVEILGKRIPKCVFYTSEFAWLNKEYFITHDAFVEPATKYIYGSDEDVKRHLSKFDSLHFTSPSEWSSEGLRDFGVPDSKNKVISHGVDTAVFYPQNDRTKRTKIREYYGVKEEDILLINIGAMTQNKGIVLILEALYNLVKVEGMTTYKLLLKGTGDLYSSQAFLEHYLEQLVAAGFARADIDYLLKNHIIFTSKTLSYNRISDLFNAADAYISPYLAEGFNLTVLESLACSLPVFVPMTGSTTEYIKDIGAHGGRPYIKQINSVVGMANTGMKQNVINVEDITKMLKEEAQYLQKMKLDRWKIGNEMNKHIQQHYTWKAVTGQLVAYLENIANDKFLEK
jgi:glycosyltransferase involved in cell wall biosynthesis